MAERAFTRSRRILLAGALLPLAARAGQAAEAQVALSGDAGERVEGSGNVVDDARSVSGFSKLTVNGPVDVRVTAADTEAVVVRADDNIAPLIETAVLGSTLVIGLRRGSSFRTRSRVEVQVRAKALQAVTLRGGGDVKVDRIDAEVFEATLQGSGDINIGQLRARAVAASVAGNGDLRARGVADTLGVVIDGNGDVYFADLVAATVAVSIRGNGDARVHATDSLQVSISGAGDVRYRGAPKITKSIRGSGSVEELR